MDFQIYRIENQIYRLQNEVQAIDKASLVNNLKYKTQKYLIDFLPEEYINDLETVRKRFKKQKLSSEEIETRITLLLLTMLRGYLICQIQNLWLNRNTIE